MRHLQYCQQMFQKNKDYEIKANWLGLATEWLRLHAEVSGDKEAANMLNRVVPFDLEAAGRLNN